MTQLTQLTLFTHLYRTSRRLCLPIYSVTFHCKHTSNTLAAMKFTTFALAVTRGAPPPFCLAPTAQKTAVVTKSTKKSKKMNKNNKKNLHVTKSILSIESSPDIAPAAELGRSEDVSVIPAPAANVVESHTTAFIGIPRTGCDTVANPDNVRTFYYYAFLLQPLCVYL